MLLTEADAINLAKKQTIIDRLKKDLKAAGIKFRDKGSTAIDIFNKVTVAQPIYTATANKNGGIDVVDKSAETLKFKDLPFGASPLGAVYGSNNKLMNLTYAEADPADGVYASSYYDYDGELRQQHPHITRSIVLVDSNNISRNDKGEIMYGHMKFDKDEMEEYLSSYDIIRDGTLETFKKPGKKAIKQDPTIMFTWNRIEAMFYENKNKMSPELLYKAAADYIINTIDSTTVNAAIKGGKDKYVLEPAIKLNDVLHAIFKNSDFDTNIDSISNEDAETPYIDFTYKPGFSFHIIVKRAGLGAKAVVTSVYNVDKTLLYNDIRGNADLLKDKDNNILVARFVDKAEHVDKGKWDFEYDEVRVARAIISYIKDNEDKITSAEGNKRKHQELIAKLQAKDDKRKAMQQKIAAKSDAYFKQKEEQEEQQRLQDLKDKEDLRNYEKEKRAILRQAKTKVQKGDYDKAADELFGNDADAYDKFLDSLVDD